MLALSKSNHRPVYSVYGGRVYSETEVDEALKLVPDDKHTIQRLNDSALIARVAQLLASNQIVGWFEGGSESGRRALGHRSLLSDPRYASLRDHLNNSVKKRQPFRPFAPVVQEDRANEFFELAQPSPYMQVVCPVREEFRSNLGAVTHVDGTARPQTIRLDQHPRWYQLLD